MATVTKGRTFTSGETVTPAKLNDVVDLATVTDIQTADIADGQITTVKILDANVTDAKLATGIDASKITTGTLPIARIADGAVVNDKLSLAANAGEIKKALNADNAPPIFACRAWVNFDGTRNEADTGASTNGANVKIRNNGNVASVLKNGTGDYTVTFTVAMPNENYAIQSALNLSGSGSTKVLYVHSLTTGAESAPTASQFRVVSFVTGVGATDLSRVSLSVFA
jgi:hypothetical protein